MTVDFWRRERDSNPRTGISRYTISNRAPSTNSAISPSILFFAVCPDDMGYYNRYFERVKHFFDFFRWNQRLFPIYLDKIRKLWYPIMEWGSSKRTLRSKSTSWPFGLACFKLRDSCMRNPYMRPYYCDAKYGYTVLGFFIFSGGKTWNFSALHFSALWQERHF